MTEADFFTFQMNGLHPALAMIFYGTVLFVVYWFGTKRKYIAGKAQWAAKSAREQWRRRRAASAAAAGSQFAFGQDQRSALGGTLGTVTDAAATATRSAADAAAETVDAARSAAAGVARAAAGVVEGGGETSFNFGADAEPQPTPPRGRLGQMYDAAAAWATSREQEMLRNQQLRMSSISKQC